MGYDNDWKKEFNPRTSRLEEKPTSSCGDGTDRLCMAVYGRPAEPRDYIGAANAQMLYDAADMIENNQMNKGGTQHD